MTFRTNDLKNTNEDAGLLGLSDFSFFWDNAYACHDLYETIKQTPIDQIAKDHDMENNYFQVGSTSKITPLKGCILCLTIEPIANLAFFSSIINLYNKISMF